MSETTETLPTKCWRGKKIHATTVKTVDGTKLPESATFCGAGGYRGLTPSHLTLADVDCPRCLKALATQEEA